MNRYLEEIRDLLHGSYKNTILPVIGAGLSSPRLPGWARLLEELIGQASPENRGALSQALAAQRFVEVVGLLEVDPRVHAAGIARAIKQTYARPHPPRPAVYDEVARLPVTHFATTNFDPWLKDAVSQQLGIAPRIYTASDPGAWSDIKQSSPPMVLMLHGDADRPETCVLSASAFRRLAHGTPAFRAGFSALIGGRALLFLGHSLRDPDLVLMLEAWAEAMTWPGLGAQAPRHYMLTTELGPVEKQSLLNLGVQPVEYGPPGDYSALPETLRWLQSRPAVTHSGNAVKSLQASVEQPEEAVPRRVVAGPDPVKWNQVNHYVDVYRLVLAGELAAAREKAVALGGHGENALTLNLRQFLLDRTDTIAEHKELSRRILAEFGDEIGSAEQALHLWFTADPSEALAKAAGALIADPGNVLAWILRGGILSVEEPAKALRNIDAADVYLRYYQSWALRLRAQLLLRLDQPEQALLAASASIELHPYAAHAYEARSAILLKLNRTTEALADLDRVLRLAPKWAYPRRMKAAVLADLGQNKEAVAAVADALAVGGPDDLMLELQEACRKQLKTKK